MVSIRPAIERNEISGAVVLVVRGGGILEFEAAGLADVRTKRQMKPDDIFWIASLTKPIVAAAVLMLADQGKLSLNDAVHKYLPEFEDLWFTAEKSEAHRLLRRCAAPTLHQLLIHTDGLADVPPPHAYTPLAEWVASVARQPLLFEPGTRWGYNNSGFNALGRIVEIVSGVNLSEFLAHNFFIPLGMKETTFVLSRKQFARLAVSYKFSVEERCLIPVPLLLHRVKPTSPRQTICPGGGLFSTATDVMRFYQMLLDGGIADGHRYLSESICQEMTTCQTGDDPTGFTEGMGFGLGVGVVRRPAGQTAMLSPGTFGHGGVYGTQAWVDPIRRSVSVLMLQRSNLTPNPDASELRQTFNNAVTAFVSSVAEQELLR